jgi:hypothetical protein
LARQLFYRRRPRRARTALRRAMAGGIQHAREFPRFREGHAGEDGRCLRLPAGTRSRVQSFILIKYFQHSCVLYVLQGNNYTIQKLSRAHPLATHFAPATTPVQLVCHRLLNRIIAHISVPKKIGWRAQRWPRNGSPTPATSVERKRQNAGWSLTGRVGRPRRIPHDIGMFSARHSHVTQGWGAVGHGKSPHD